MALYVPSGSDYKWSLSTTTGRPTTAFGTSVTPGTNTMGSYAQLIAGASVTNDVWAILININSCAVSAAIRSALVDIGIDEAGGTSYTVKIPYLLVTSASPYNIGSGGVWYYFPLFIKAGSSIAARAQVNNATVGTLRCWATLFGQPRRPETTRLGQYVHSFGQTTASSSGTVFTCGTTAEGAWTQLGSATTRPLWWWQIGFDCAEATPNWTAQVIHLDNAAGDATTKKVIIENLVICTTTAEQINNSPLTAGCTGNVAVGDLVYGRGQSSGTPDTPLSMMAYGLG